MPRGEVTATGHRTDSGLYLHEWVCSEDEDRSSVLAVHDITGHGGHFADIAARLATHHRVVAPDLRGRGRSRAVPTTPTTSEDRLGAHLADLGAILGDRGLTVADTVVIGVGFGALLAWELAIATPHTSCPLLIVDPPCPGVTPSPVIDPAATWANPDSYLRAQTAGGRVPRSGLSRGARAAVLDDLVGSGFLWRPRLHPQAVAGDRAVQDRWHPTGRPPRPVHVLTTTPVESLPVPDAAQTFLDLEGVDPLFSPDVTTWVETTLDTPPDTR